jgi:hypothetical protein
MTNLETVAAQRDELATKLHAAGKQLAAAQAEIERLKQSAQPSVDAPVIPQPATDRRFTPPEVPSASPPKSKRPRIFGSS